jgi:hypothetical protein
MFVKGKIICPPKYVIPGGQFIANPGSPVIYRQYYLKVPNLVTLTSKSVFLNITRKGKFKIKERTK